MSQMTLVPGFVGAGHIYSSVSECQFCLSMVQCEFQSSLAGAELSTRLLCFLPKHMFDITLLIRG